MAAGLFAVERAGDTLPSPARRSKGKWVVNDVRPSTLPPPALNNPGDFGKWAFLACRDLDQLLPSIERLLKQP
jgi:hypothetical protein